MTHFYLLKNYLKYWENLMSEDFLEFDFTYVYQILDKPDGKQKSPPGS